jgi:hypothetical protein
MREREEKREKLSERERERERREGERKSFSHIILVCRFYPRRNEII